MPGFVNHPKLVVTWIRHCKIKIFCTTDKPGECQGLLEFFGEWFATVSGNINRSASVVFAVTRRGADPENLFYFLSCDELAFDNLPLVSHTSKS